LGVLPNRTPRAVVAKKFNAYAFLIDESQDAVHNNENNCAGNQLQDADRNTLPDRIVFDGGRWLN
jgi:hypothetical protein